MNSYITVDTLKSKGMLDQEKSVNDQELLTWGISSSRDFDHHLGRHFYSYQETRYQNGPGRNVLTVPDLIAITTLKTDDDGDGTFETTWATSDYILSPFNADPTTRTNPRSTPYYEIIVDGNGNQNSFPTRIRSVEINGEWGYWRHLRRATETINASTNATTTDITITTRTDIQAGHTILVNSEQMFVESYEGLVLTVIRGANGTTAATHSSTDVIDIYEYPPSLVQAVSITVAKMFHRRHSQFASQIGLPDGSMQIFRGMDSDVLRMMDEYRLVEVG